MKSRLLRNTVYGSLAGCSTTICNFVSGLIVARVLGAHRMGEVAFLIWIANTAAVVIGFGIPFSASKYLLGLEARKGAKAALALARFLVVRFCAIALVPFLVALALAATSDSFRSHLAHISENLGGRCELILVGSLCFVLAVGEFSRSISRGTHRFDDLARVSIASGLVQCLAVFVLVSAYEVNGALLAYAIGGATFFLLLRPLVGVKSTDDCDRSKTFRRFAAFRWGSEVLSLFIWSRIEVIYLQYYCGASSVALFTVALTLVSLAVQGPMMLTWGLIPHFVERNAAPDHLGMQKAFEQATRLLAMLVLPSCLGMAAIANSLVPLLFGPTFAPAQHVAEILVVASAYPVASTAVSAVLLASDRSDIDFYACLAGTIVSLVLGVVLTRHFGLVGASWSRAIVQTFVASCGVVFLWRRLKLSLPIRALAKVTLSAGCCATVAAVTSRLEPGMPFLILAILAGAATYAVCLLVFRVLEPRELYLLGHLASNIIRLLNKPFAADRRLPG